MYQLNDNLAVMGFDLTPDFRENNLFSHEYDPSNYGVITDPKYDKSGYMVMFDENVWTIVDCRTLLDDWPSPIQAYKTLISSAINYLNNDRNVVCSCSAGQSRSNAIALGVLIEYNNMNFYDAWDLIREKNPLCNIAMHHLDVLKHMYKVTLP
jgi:hypothetical protein